MSKSYRLVIFDWEGTLSDTLGQVLNCLAIEAKRLQLGEFDKGVVRQCVDLGLAKVIKKLFPYSTLQQQEKLLQAVQHALLTRSTETFLIPGAEKFINQLQSKGVCLAIATNKGSQSLQRALQACELDKLFKVTRSAGQTQPKPDPQMLEEILAVYNIAPKDALMIGDSVNDVIMAKSIHVDVVGFDFYHQQGDALHQAGALKVFDNYQQMAEFLQLPHEKETLL